ncbi:MAG TPA: GAF domain-containing protein [Candidatus Acidoferrales bacterium]|nr:GAF domain-containing protein [Candidatus Acidoferrales bacterium]
MPRSLRFYVAASSIYAALVFLAVHLVYGIELGASGLRFPDPEALINSIDIVSFIVWLGISLIAATVMYRLAMALEGAQDEGQQRQGEIASIYALGSALSGSLDVDEIADRFLGAALTSLGPTVTGALYVQEEDGFRLAREQGPSAGKHWPPRYSPTTLPAPLRTRVVDHKGTLVLADATSSTAWQPLAADVRNSALIRSFAAMPIVSHDRLVGIALFTSDRVGTLAADALQIVALGAQFLASALRTGLSFREAEARGNREAIVNRIAQRARAAHDPDAVLKATVDELARALGVRRVGVSLGSSPDELRIAHSWSRPGPVPPPTLAASQQAAATGRTTQVSDESASRLATPIVIAGELAGVLAISDEPTREWSFDDVRLVEAVARELRGAIEAARLLQSRQRENERLLALQRASTVIATRSTTREVIDEVLRASSQLLAQASASLYLWDANAQVLRLAQNTDPEGRDVSATLPRDEGASGALLERLEPVVVSDYPAWSGATATGLATGLRAVLAVPLVRAGQLVGAIVLRSYDPATRFAIDDARLLGLFGDLAVAALTNAEAFERQRNAMEQLERVNRAKSEFVSIVSHEFRTPLTGIQGFSEMMRDEELTPEEMKEYASDINKDAQRLNRLINDMLDLSRMEAGRMSLDRQETDLNTIVTDAADRVRPNAPAHPITLELDPAVPALSADRDRLTQVVANLLSNAVKYSPTGGAIVVRTARETEGVHLSVRDHGMGIPTEALESIWEQYSRVESKQTRGIQGTGLGLPIVRQIVRMHGGKAWAESEIGRGSVFHVLLPLAPGSQAVEA